VNGWHLIAHDGSTRNWWVAETLRKIFAEPQPNANTPPETFSRVIRALMDQGDAVNDGTEREGALALLNASLTREGLEAFYAPDKLCYLRHLATNTVATVSPNPHRPFSASELKRRGQLIAYLDVASEDALIAEVLFCGYTSSTRMPIAAPMRSSAAVPEKARTRWGGETDCPPAILE
jgi:hypothetical protein